MGASDERPDEGRFLSYGTGALDIPQGVTVIGGPARDLVRFVDQDLLEPGQPLPAAARRHGLDIRGFRPADLVLLEKHDTPAPLPDTSSDKAAWARAQATDTAQAYRAYLGAYPQGRHVAAARQRIKAITSEPYYAQRKAEEALDLSRNQRREIQRDLTTLGFDTRGIDGVFGRGTRGAVTNWQRQTGEEASSYLDAGQIARLARTAQRRRAEIAEEERRKKAERDARDHALWAKVEARGDEASLQDYLERFPDGLYANEARRRLSELVSIRERNMWGNALSQDTVAAYRAYLQAWPAGDYADRARARIKELEGIPDESDAIRRARAQEEALGLSSITRQLAEARLKQIGLDPGRVDGRFDENTRNALRLYQQKRGMPVTGYIDEQTALRLMAGGIFGGGLGNR